MRIRSTGHSRCSDAEPEWDDFATGDFESGEDDEA